MKTYIYDGMEVKLTGRVASKKRKRRSSTSDEFLIHEIKPIDDKIDFCTWVELNDLYEVVDEG